MNDVWFPMYRNTFHKWGHSLYEMSPNFVLQLAYMPGTQQPIKLSVEISCWLLVLISANEWSRFTILIILFVAEPRYSSEGLRMRH